jgi:protein phosphatase
VAALTAVETLRRAFDDDHSAAGLVHATLRANRAVWERSQQDTKLRGMGTTLCTLALVVEDGEERIAIVNVGDSRAYRLHDGELEQLTEDHSLINDLLREGQISEEEAAVHPQRHVLTRVVGVDPDVEADCVQLLPLAGDRYVLCSDGLTREVSDGQMASTLRRLADPKEAVKALISQAKVNGGNDNITVVVVDVTDDDDRSENASAALANEPAPVVVQEEEKGRSATGEPSVIAPSPPALPVPTPPKPPIFTARTVIFLVLLAAILGAAALAVGVYARASYFVGVGPQQKVTVFKGRPGGVLWFKPTVDSVTPYTLSELQAQAQEAIKANKTESSRGAANDYLARNLVPATTVPATTVPSTTVPSTTVPSSSTTRPASVPTSVP